MLKKEINMLFLTPQIYKRVNYEKINSNNY